MSKNLGGRPSKLTFEVQERVLQAVRAGNYIEVAAAYAGVAKSTVFDWMKQGAEEKDRRAQGREPYIDKDVYVEFSDAIQKALAEAEVRDVALIGKAAQEHWQAAAWRLERKFPARWGRKDKLEHTGKVETRGDHDVTTRIMADESLYKMAEDLLLKAAGRGARKSDEGGDESEGEN